MTAQDLKNSILQLAIQGKLVPQDKNDEPASVLLEKIKTEKEQLIKDKKLKRGKPFSPITDDKKPFDIPDSWEWVRLGDCMSNNSGLSYKKDSLNIKSKNMVRVLRGGNIFELFYKFKEDDIFISNEYVKSSLFLNKNQLITPAVTSLEHIGKLARIDKDYADVVAGGFVLILILFLNIDTFSQYLLYSLSSKYHRDQCKKITNKSGQAFYNLSREKLMKLIIPLPPLAEQQRIVDKIEELMPFVEQYDKSYTKLEKLNKKFPIDMQKSILQYAVQGKLVPQDKNDETASVLLEKIKAEKEQLIKDKKRKTTCTDNQ